MRTGLDARSHQIINKKTLLVVVLLALTTLGVGGCAMNETQQRTSTGAAVGAIGGAVLGTSRQSAAIGAAVGAAGGYLFDQFNKREDAQTENAQLREENARLREQANQ